MVKTLTITLNQFAGVPSTSSLEIDFSEEKSLIHLNSTCDFSAHIMPHTISFAVIHESTVLAGSTIALERILSQRSKTIWVQCKDLSEAKAEIRVKITVILLSTAEPTSDCPYLELLASGKVENRLSNYVKNSQNEEKKSAKITLEPDAPPRLGAEIKVYEANSLGELDTSRLESIGGDQIKKSVRVLNEENKKLGQNSLSEHREDLKKQVNARVDQEEEYEKFTENTILEITELLAQLCGIEEQRNLLRADLLGKNEKNRESHLEIDGLKAEIGGFNRKILALKAERVRFRDIENLLESLKRFESENGSQKEALEKRLQSSHIAADAVRQSSSQVASKLDQDGNYYKGKLKVLLESEKALTEHNSSLRSALSDLKVSLSATVVQSPSNISLTSNERYSKLSQLQDLHSSSFQHDQETKLKIKSSLQQKHKIFESLIETYKVLEAKHHQNLQKDLEIYLNSNELIYLEQTCCIQGDISNLTESLSKIPKFHNAANKSALKYLDGTSSHMLKETENIRDQCGKISQIMENVIEKDAECDRVRVVMGEVKERHPPFIPKLDDPIDVALFEFIKSCELPIPIPFTREEPGIYLFGTKRVFLKLENGNIVIRIGGGYTSIMSFIEIYTPLELERQEENIEEACPQMKTTTLARFSQSPQKGMSPLRASRILQGSVEVGNAGFKPASPFRKTPIKK